MPKQAGYFPHPITAEATHAEADLPNVRPVDSSVSKQHGENNPQTKDIALTDEGETTTATEEASDEREHPEQTLTTMGLSESYARMKAPDCKRGRRRAVEQRRPHPGSST